MTSQRLADKVAAATFTFDVLASIAAEKAEHMDDSVVAYDSWCRADAMADVAYGDLVRLETKSRKFAKKASR